MNAKTIERRLHRVDVTAARTRLRSLCDISKNSSVQIAETDFTPCELGITACRPRDPCVINADSFWSHISANNSRRQPVLDFSTVRRVAGKRCPWRDCRFERDSECSNRPNRGWIQGWGHKTLTSVFLDVTVTSFQPINFTQKKSIKHALKFPNHPNGAAIFGSHTSLFVGYLRHYQTSNRGSISGPYRRPLRAGLQQLSGNSFYAAKRYPISHAANYAIQMRSR